MIVLCTAQPTAELDGDRILITLPSGKDRIEAALTVNQAMSLGAFISLRSREAITAGNRSAEIAQVLPLVARKRRRP